MNKALKRSICRFQIKDKSIAVLHSVAQNCGNRPIEYWLGDSKATRTGQGGMAAPRDNGSIHDNKKSAYRNVFLKDGGCENGETVRE